MKIWMVVVGLLAGLVLLCWGCGTIPSTPPVVAPARAATPSVVPSRTPTLAPSPAGTAIATATRTTAPPSPTPTNAAPSPAPTPMPEVRVYEETIPISTYPFGAYLVADANPTYGGMVLRLDRAAYEASGPSPAPQAYRALVVENEHLRLTFLPELGGRLYQCVYKPTGQPLFYNNRVLKPTYWGPLPRDANWWLAAGGLEWAFPVHEHGYEWGAPWDVAVRRQGDSVQVVLSRESGALRAEVTIALAAGEGRFVVSPRLANTGSRAVPVQFWANAMLSPGGASVGPDLRFVFPAAQVVVHSTGDPALPGEGQTMPWPLAGGRDWSRYAEWRNWLGVFAAEPLPQFVGVYDTHANMGAARVLAGAGGAKLFAFGAEFPDFATFADDGSAYVELWAGANRSFWPVDDRLLAPGESLGWAETWIPIAGLGGFTAATEEAVVRLERDGDGVVVGAYSPVTRHAVLRVTAAGASVVSERVSLGPGRPWLLRVPSSDGPLHLRLYADDGILLAEAVCP